MSPPLTAAEVCNDLEDDMRRGANLLVKLKSDIINFFFFCSFQFMKYLHLCNGGCGNGSSMNALISILIGFFLRFVRNQKKYFFYIANSFDTPKPTS